MLSLQLKLANIDIIINKEKPVNELLNIGELIGLIDLFVDFVVL